MRFEHGHWPLEPEQDQLHSPGASRSIRRNRTIPSARENMLVTTVAVAALCLSWLVAAASGAATAASCFMWLLFGCCVVISVALAFERAIHLLRVWDQRQEERD
jgi:hypothetical protein